MAKETKFINFTLKIHHRTEKAILVSDDDNEAKAKWLPLSQVDIEMVNENDQIAEVRVPEWLAKRNGMI